VADHDPLDDLDALDDLESVGEPADASTPPVLPHGDALTGPAADRIGGKRGAEEAFARGAELDEEAGEQRLLSFYDRLRGRIVRALDRRGGKMGRGVADALLLVPDMFMLLVRLALDPAVPMSTRGLIGGALAYFILPFDLLPEGLIGGVGYLDDLVLASAVLTQALSPALEERARNYWSGREELRQVLQDVVGSAQSLLGEGLMGRLERLLSRRGIALPRPVWRDQGGNGARAAEGFEGDPGSELA